MLSSIWMQCEGDSEIRPIRTIAWRIVEAQHLVSTRKLVDSADEQTLLEELIDSVKPPEPTDGRLHYLLFTPFRYPPLGHGSRFGTRFERGIWYGSESRHTAFSEVAYYRLLFLEGTAAELGVVSTPLTAFTIRMHSSNGVDLASPPFDTHRSTIASRTRYDATQELGRAMREAGVEMFRYPSARDPEKGSNIAAFIPSVFGSAKPRLFETWHSTATRERVELRQGDYFMRETFAFVREQFTVEGSLPSPAL